MEELTLARVAEMSRGRCVGGADRVVRAVTSDSRALESGSLFVALKGERLNGHEFLGDAVKRGAVGAMVAESEMRDRACGLPLILVEETLAGLQRFARTYRGALKACAVAVAGSNGKTGVKEMVAAVLGVRFAVLKNPGNWNNHIGVPLSLLRLEASHQIGVFEVGTNHPGELAPLIEMIQPRVGIITTIGEEHLEFFRDLAGVAEEEGTLADLLPADGLLALNADDEWTAVIARRCKARMAGFGFSATADYRAMEVNLDFSGTRFRLRTPRGEAEIRLQLLGRHQASNAAAAAAVGEFFGLDLNEIRQGLEAVAPGKMRMERAVTRGGVRIINDAYNANPGSMSAALETVRDVSVEGRRVAILGEMRELGAAAESAHRAAGRKAAESGLDLLVVVGEGARLIVEGARTAEHPPARIEFFQEPRLAGEFVRGETTRGDLVLVKASRGAELETALEGWF